MHAGHEYFLSFSLPLNEGIEITKVVTSCACLDVLHFPKTISNNSQNEFYMLFKPVKAKKHIIDLELQTSKGRSKFLFSSEVLEGKNVAENKFDYIPSMLTRRLSNHESKLYVSPVKAIKAIDKFEIIDLGKTTRYNELHIPKSKNFSFNILKTIDFLKDKIYFWYPREITLKNLKTSVFN